MTTKLYGNKNEGNENKIILGDFNCTMEKIARYGGNKTQTIYRCCSNYALIVDNESRIYGERRTEIPPEFTQHDRSFGEGPG